MRALCTTFEHIISRISPVALFLFLIPSGVLGELSQTANTFKFYLMIYTEVKAILPVMFPLHASLPVYILSFVVLLGGFSHFTHGEYTPGWFAFQEYHSPDDGSAVAIIAPIADTVVGLMLLFGNWAVKLSAATTSLLFFMAGLVMQLQARKEYQGDVALVGLGAVAVAVLLWK